MSVPPNRFAVSLAFVGSRAAPLSPIEVITNQGNVLLERPVPEGEGSTMLLLTRPLNVRKAQLAFANQPSHHHHGRNRKSSSVEKKKTGSFPSAPSSFSSDPQVDKKAQVADQDEDNESDSSGGLPSAHIVAKPPPSELNEQPVRPSPGKKHSHRRSLSTSDHVHFHGKSGPPMLTPLAFEPDETLDDDDAFPSKSTVGQHSASGSVVGEDKEDNGSVASNSSRMSVVRIHVSPSHSQGVTNGGTTGLTDGGMPNSTALEQKLALAKGPLARVASTDVPVLSSMSPSSAGGQPRVGGNSPHYRPRRSSAPDMEVISEKIAEATDSEVEKGPTPPPSIDSKGSSNVHMLHGSTPKSLTGSGNESTRSSRSLKKHYRQLSAPVFVGGGVDATLDDPKGTGGGGEVKLDDGIVITRSGISSNATTPDRALALIPTPNGQSSTKAANGRSQLYIQSSNSTHYEDDSSSVPSSLNGPSPRPSPGFFNPDELLMLEEVGRGSAGIVIRALHFSSLNLVAVKSVQKFDMQKRETTIAEVKALYRKMRPFTSPDRVDPNAEEASCILGFYDAFISEDEAQVNLVLEWMDGGSLQDLVDKRKKQGTTLSEDFVSIACRRMLKGLCELFEERLLHRDMKPANVLVSRSGAIKLSDFGVSVAFRQGEMSAAKTFVGSLSYMAPERVQASDDNAGYSYASDLWGVGLIAYVCATGGDPYEKVLEQEGYWGVAQAVSEEVPSLDPTKFSPDLVDFVAQCLRRDPEERPSAQEHLNHPFVMRFVDRPEEANRIVKEAVGSVDQTTARAQLNTLLDKAAHFYASNSNKLQHTLPRFSMTKVRGLARQVGVDAINDNEVEQIVKSFNSKLLTPGVVASAKRNNNTNNVSPASGGSSLESASKSSPRAIAPGASMWRRNNLKLDVTM